MKPLYPAVSYYLTVITFFGTVVAASLGLWIGGLRFSFSILAGIVLLHFVVQLTSAAFGMGATCEMRHVAVPARAQPSVAPPPVQRYGVPKDGSTPMLPAVQLVTVAQPVQPVTIPPLPRRRPMAIAESGAAAPDVGDDEWEPLLLNRPHASYLADTESSKAPRFGRDKRGYLVVHYEAGTYSPAWGCRVYGRRGETERVAYCKDR
jgi:hypothetical protein